MTRPWNVFISHDEEGKLFCENINFGRVNEDKSYQLTYYIKNNEKEAVFNIEYICKSKNISVEGPTSLDSMETGILKVKWGITEQSLSLKDVLDFKCEIISPVG